jgi:RHS repeat-associated protein
MSVGFPNHLLEDAVQRAQRAACRYVRTGRCDRVIEDTKLVRFGARDYDPGMGRWTNKDPIGFAGGDTNIYAYVGNDPVNLVDLSGLRDFFGGVEVDLVKFVGVEVGVGVVIDSDHPLQSGIYFSGGPSVGLNMGASVQFGVAARDIEGVGVSVDVNADVVSPVVSRDDNDINSIAVGVGPGVGASFALSGTGTISVEKVINAIKRIIR